jgi:hypothetical protein
MSHATSSTFSKFWSCIILVFACLTCLNSASAQITYCPEPTQYKHLVSSGNCGAKTHDYGYWFGSEFNYVTLHCLRSMQRQLL